MSIISPLVTYPSPSWSYMPKRRRRRSSADCPLSCDKPVTISGNEMDPDWSESNNRNSAVLLIMPLPCRDGFRRRVRTGVAPSPVSSVCFASAVDAPSSVVADGNVDEEEEEKEEEEEEEEEREECVCGGGDEGSSRLLVDAFKFFLPAGCAGEAKTVSRTFLNCSWLHAPVAPVMKRNSF